MTHSSQVAVLAESKPTVLVIGDDQAPRESLGGCCDLSRDAATALEDFRMIVIVPALLHFNHCTRDR